MSRITPTFTDEMKAKIAANVRKARKAKNMAQIDLAVASGLEIRQIIRIEKAESNLTTKSLYLIVKALGLKSSDLLPY